MQAVVPISPILPIVKYQRARSALNLPYSKGMKLHQSDEDNIVLPVLHGDSGLPPGFGEGEEIKTTTSVCPTCLAMLPATVRRRGRKVYLEKCCPEHGSFSALLASDVRHYYEADERVESVACCCSPGQHCGDQVANHSCNMLIEITQSCNLTCPTCYANSSPHNKRFMSVLEFSDLLDGLLEKGKGGADLMQLSGGEPTIHPQFFEILQIALDKGIRQVYVNTNGIRLAQKEFAYQLASFDDRVSVYLQFDGFRESTLEKLRGRGDLLDTKLRAADHCEQMGLNCVPIITLTPGVNDDEVGKFLDFALKRPQSIRKVMIQPAMYSGRYDNPRLLERMTLADVVRLICDQTQGVFCDDDFTPIPCSDPNCFSMAAALRSPGGLVPVTRYLPKYEDWASLQNRELIAAVADTFDDAKSFSGLLQRVVELGGLDAMDESTVDALLDLLEQMPVTADDSSNEWDGMFAIGIKPFMDAYTYDQDRIDKCCVHIISADGTPVSFCEYNAIHRPSGRG